MKLTLGSRGGKEAGGRSGGDINRQTNMCQTGKGALEVKQAEGLAPACWAGARGALVICSQVRGTEQSPEERDD